jgi:hypothetical protein
MGRHNRHETEQRGNLKMSRHYVQILDSLLPAKHRKPDQTTHKPQRADAEERNQKL